MASATAPIFVGGLLIIAIVMTFFILTVVLISRGVRRAHRFFGSFVGGVLAPDPGRRQQRQRWNNRYVAAITSTHTCPDSRCGADNPATARFCRRCGSPMDPMALRRPAQPRRVAMW